VVRPFSIRRRCLGDQSGFTLPELLVAMSMMVTVLFALCSIFDMSVRIFTSGKDDLKAVEEARLGLEKMEREIRAAYPRDDGTLISVAGEREITFQNRPDSGPPETITYDLSSGSSSYLRRNGQRVVGPLDGADGLLFAYCTSAADCSSTISEETGIKLVRMTLKASVPGPMDATQTLTTDVYLRNREARQ
jgi:prepilin-type N-terminal cleavage/methylation domain-containing protein